MVDDNFKEPTYAELSQAHIRAAMLAVHPCRGQYVRDAEGRLGVLAADQDWRNDPLTLREEGGGGTSKHRSLFTISACDAGCE